MAMHGTNPHTRSIKQALVITGGGNRQSACLFERKKAWSTYALVRDYLEYLQKKQRKQGLIRK